MKLLGQTVARHLLVPTEGLSDLGTVAVLVDFALIMKLKLRFVVRLPQLVQLSVFLLADKNALVKKLAVLACIESIIVHRPVLLV